MSPPFGSKDKKEAREQDLAAVRAVLERMSALPLEKLAAEVMVKGFGPDGPGAPGLPGTWEAPGMLATTRYPNHTVIAQKFTDPHWSYRSGDEPWERLKWLVAEGLQALEHASLVRTIVRGYADGGADAYWVATRLGRAALARDAVEHVLTGAKL